MHSSRTYGDVHPVTKLCCESINKCLRKCLPMNTFWKVLNSKSEAYRLVGGCHRAVLL